MSPITEAPIIEGPLTEAPIIEAHGLTKAYGKTKALAGLDLVAEPGQVLAILGPNGAGKTTFIRSVATLVRPDGGTLQVAGHDVFREPEYVRSMVGLAGQYAAVEPTMTGRENLRMVARLFGQSKKQASDSTDAVLDQMGLTEAADRLVRTYSGGMRRKLDLGASLVGVPRLLLLDEPTTGLDPRARIDLWEAISRLVEQGTDVLLTTQYLDEADHLASRIVIIDHGKAIASGTPTELKQRAGNSVVEVHVREAGDLPGVAAALAALSNGEPQIDEATRRVSVSVAAGTDQLIAELPKLYGVSGALEDIAVRHPKLDEVFLALTGQALEDPAPEGTGKRGRRNKHAA